jgi:Squalene/phytoene synthase
VDFNVIIEEFGIVNDKYKGVIQDIAKRMGNGMADYANNAAHNLYGVNTLDDFDLYCYYVAGLVGEGLTRLFIASGQENPKLSEALDLYVPQELTDVVPIQWVYSFKRQISFEIIVKIWMINGNSGQNKSGQNTQMIYLTLLIPKIWMLYPFHRSI